MPLQSTARAEIKRARRPIALLQANHCASTKRQNTEAKASTLEDNAWTFEAKAFKHIPRAEIRIHSTSGVLLLKDTKSMLERHAYQQ